jgi:hypothetical protein
VLDQIDPLGVTALGDVEHGAVDAGQFRRRSGRRVAVNDLKRLRFPRLQVEQEPEIGRARIPADERPPQFEPVRIEQADVIAGSERLGAGDERCGAAEGETPRAAVERLAAVVGDRDRLAVLPPDVGRVVGALNGPVDRNLRMGRRLSRIGQDDPIRERELDFIEIDARRLTDARLLDRSARHPQNGGSGRRDRGERALRPRIDRRRPVRLDRCAQDRMRPLYQLNRSSGNHIDVVGAAPLRERDMLARSDGDKRRVPVGRTDWRCGCRSHPGKVQRSGVRVVNDAVPAPRGGSARGIDLPSTQVGEERRVEVDERIVGADRAGRVALRPPDRIGRAEIHDEPISITESPGRDRHVSADLGDPIVQEPDERPLLIAIRVERPEQRQQGRLGRVARFDRKGHEVVAAS